MVHWPPQHVPPVPHIVRSFTLVRFPHMGVGPVHTWLPTWHAFPGAVHDWP